MQRKLDTSVFYDIPAPVDQRPVGSLLFADPSMAEIPQRIKQFNEPYDRNSVDGERGIASITGRLVPWHDRQANTVGEGQWLARNRKRHIPPSILEDE